MPRKRTESTPLEVDVDGIDIPATLRPPGDGRASYYVRWKLNGKWHSASTGTDVLFEAKRIGREIIRGERFPQKRASAGLTVEQFVKAQREHYDNCSVKRKGDRSFKRFDGVWNAFQKHFLVTNIQDVDADIALAYIQLLKDSRRDVNYSYKTKSERSMAGMTIRSHVATLRAAWNRVRLGHPKAVAGIERSCMVTTNPWEEVGNNLPKAKKKDIVQFDLDGKEFESLLDHFAEREVARLFLIVSLWSAGRLEEMSEIQWDWIEGDGYVVIPAEIAKKGYGKVVRIPPSILARLQAVRVSGSVCVFAGFPDELKAYYRQTDCTKHHADKVLDFTPARLRWRMSKHIKKWVKDNSAFGISHHAIRRTAMELSDEGELHSLEEKSAEKLRTTTGNKRANYLRRTVSKRHYLLADALYANLTASLRQFPDLARRVGVEEPTDQPGAEGVREIISGLSPTERQELLRELLRGALDEDQGVA